MVPYPSFTNGTSFDDLEWPLA